MGGRLDDWQGFEEVYRETSVPVLRFLRRRLPGQLAEDALSEVYLTAWRRRLEVRGEYLPWLYGIARLVAANALRSAGRAYRLRELMLATAEDRPGAAAEDGAMGRIAAVEALDRMPDKDREALILVAWDGLGTRQAAQVAGCGVAAFSVRLHRARRRLEDLLAEDEGNGTERGSDDGYERGTGEGTALGARSGRRGVRGAGPGGA
ncbi:RNA polymerase sigma factor [Streptomyces cyaneofuscatus]|uniref:RNA polymerase sigma factor n=1 Tax=Streptomyces cyaneofuscatus TaxID=66883 RepID=UPI0036DE103A